MKTENDLKEIVKKKYYTIATNQGEGACCGSFGESDSGYSFVCEDYSAQEGYHAEVDVAISNCVLNLVPDQKKAFSEMCRVIRDGGHFCISDIVLQGELSPELKESAELYAGCVSGAWQEDDCLELIEKTGFENVKDALARANYTAEK